MANPIIIGGIALTEPCTRTACILKPTPYCWVCNGSGWQSTSEGDKLIEFLRDYGKFAHEDHGHSIS